jgi:hypothetical protein
MTDADESLQNEGLQDESHKVREVAAFVAGGGAVGALTSTTVGGNMGLAVAGTAVSVGLLPVAALGMVIGLAAYGVKRALFDDVKSTTSPDTSATDQDDATQTHLHSEDSASSSDMSVSD